MAHRGSIVDLATRTARDRDGLSHALERVEVVDGVLYHARPVAYRTFDYHERWVLPVQGWVLNRFRWLVEPELDWYIEPELISIEDDCWTIRDGLLDLWVFEGSHYRVDDADELADALETGEISLADGMRVLRSFQALERALREAECSGLELLRRYAPGVAHFETPTRC